MAESKVKFFKDGERMGIQTTATQEYEFINSSAEALATMIHLGAFNGDWGAQLQNWLPQIVDIVCKLRGYKADVHEQRVLTAGIANFSSTVMVYPPQSSPEEED